MGRRSVAIALLAVFAAVPALASPRRRRSLHRPATKLHVALSLDEEGRPQYSIARNGKRQCHRGSWTELEGA
jgi:hypothetical protein